MPCDIESSIAEVIAAYEAKCAECCTPDTDCLALLPSNQSNLCGDGTGLIREIHAAVEAVVSSTPTGCTDWLLDIAYPLPEMGDCLTIEILADLRAAIVNISCVPLDPYYYNACPLQCGTAEDDTIIKSTVADVLIIKYQGVFAYYERAGAVIPDTTPDTDETIISPTSSCPSEANKTKICYQACCQPIWEVDYSDCPTHMVISQNEFDDLFPELGGDPSDTCIHYKRDNNLGIGDEDMVYCCYCNPTYVVNPKNSTGEDVTASEEINCDDCVAGEEGATCECCDYPRTECCACEPQLPAAWLVTFSGFTGYNAPSTAAAELFNDSFVLSLTDYDICEWMYTFPAPDDANWIRLKTGCVGTPYVELTININWGPQHMRMEFQVTTITLPSLDICDPDDWNGMPKTGSYQNQQGAYVIEPWGGDEAP